MFEKTLEYFCSRTLFEGAKSLANGEAILGKHRSWKPFVFRPKDCNRESGSVKSTTVFED